MQIIDAQVHAYERNHPGHPVHPPASQCDRIAPGRERRRPGSVSSTRSTVSRIATGSSAPNAGQFGLRCQRTHGSGGATFLGHGLGASSFGFGNRSGAPPWISTTPRPDAQGLDQKNSVRRPHSDELPRRTVQSKGVSPNSLPLLSTLIDLLAVRRLTA
jgi:hypothetical protein